VPKTYIQFGWDVDQHLEAGNLSGKDEDEEWRIEMDRQPISGGDEERLPFSNEAPSESDRIKHVVHRSGALSWRVKLQITSDNTHDPCLQA
jgi:hypothetical protein